MGIPKRAQRQQGTYAVVDGIHFPMPIDTRDSQAFLAAFTIDATKAAALLPGQELHPVRLWKDRALLLVTVINYEHTDIGKYIEFSIGIACTRGERPAPRLLPMLLRGRYGFGQYVVDLPVSSEVSVKGGKGIWGMPKHQAPLDFLVDGRRVSSQYDLDGELVMRVDIGRPKRRWFPLTMNAANYSHFRGMLMKSYVAFQGAPRFSFLRPQGSLEIGDHPRLAPLKDLDISRRPLFTSFYPDFGGVLDDYMESWFVTWPDEQVPPVEGLETVFHLGQSQEWPDPPHRLRP
ncbi:MAG: acetoacetate decarboxylase family protein [Dehalococcoidia bacterium]